MAGQLTDCAHCGTPIFAGYRLCSWCEAELREARRLRERLPEYDTNAGERLNGEPAEGE